MIEIEDDVPPPGRRRRGRAPQGLSADDDGLPGSDERELRRRAAAGDRAHLQALETSYGRINR